MSYVDNTVSYFCVLARKKVVRRHTWPGKTEHKTTHRTNKNIYLGPCEGDADDTSGCARRRLGSIFEGFHRTPNLQPTKACPREVGGCQEEWADARLAPGAFYC